MSERIKTGYVLFDRKEKAYLHHIAYTTNSISLTALADAYVFHPKLSLPDNSTKIHAESLLGRKLYVRHVNAIPSASRTTVAKGQTFAVTLQRKARKKMRKKKPKQRIKWKNRKRTDAGCQIISVRDDKHGAGAHKVVLRVRCIATDRPFDVVAQSQHQTRFHPAVRTRMNRMLRNGWKRGDALPKGMKK